MVPLALVLSINSGEAATSCGVLGKSMTARFESLQGEVWCRDVLKPKYYSYRSEVKDTWIVGIYPSRCKTVSLCRPDLTQVIGVNSLLLWLGVKLLIYT